MAKTFVRFIRDHVVVVPATVLEMRYMGGGAVMSTIDVPERRVCYAEGSQHSFRLKRDAVAFCAAVGGAAVLGAVPATTP